MMISLLSFVTFFGTSQQEPHTAPHGNPVRLVASEEGKEAEFPSSRWYKAVLSNSGKEPISLSAVQMPGGYLGDGRFFACSLQIRDKNGKWVTRTSDSDSFANARPRIVKVQVASGETLKVCFGLYPQQHG